MLSSSQYSLPLPEKKKDKTGKKKMMMMANITVYLITREHNKSITEDLFKDNLFLSFSSFSLLLIEKRY